MEAAHIIQMSRVDCHLSGEPLVLHFGDTQPSGAVGIRAEDAIEIRVNIGLFLQRHTAMS